MHPTGPEWSQVSQRGVIDFSQTESLYSLIGAKYPMMTTSHWKPNDHPRASSRCCTDKLPPQQGNVAGIDATRQNIRGLRRLPETSSLFR
eukprot:scaffold2963_cov250-Pinguiococcus_pyrenoidosus.AAC.4